MIATAARARPWLLPVMVFVGLAVVTALWLALDRRPPEWDHANHLERATLCARDLRAGDVQAILERSSFYPPLVLCLVGATSLVMPTEAAAGLVMLAFLGLGMAAVYRLGRILAGESVGRVAALLFATAPFAVYCTLRLQLDLPLAAMVALALVALLATEDFTRRGPAVVCGVVCGLGMLTKPTFALYVVPAALCLLFRSRRRGLLGAGLTLIVAAAVSLPWFGPRLFGLGAQIDARSFAQAAEAGQPEALTLAGLTFYPRWLGYEVGLGVAAFAVLGLLVAVGRRQGYVVISVLAPFVVLELIRNKNLRYALPLLAGVAVLAALGLDGLPTRIRRLATAALVVLAIVQVSAVASGVPRNFQVPGLRASWVPASAPQRADWRHRDILALLARDSHGAPATVSVVPNFAVFSTSNFRYYGLRDGLGLRFVRAWDDPPLGIDYMILKTGDQGPSWTAEKSRRASDRLASDPNLARVFPVIGEFPLPDGSAAIVRARRAVPVTGATPAAIAASVEAGLRRRLPDFARETEGLEIRVLYDEAILAGHIQHVEVRAAAATLGEFARPGTAHLRVHDLVLAVDDLLVNPWSALADGGFDPLDAGRLRLETATVRMADLQAFVTRLKHFRGTTVAAAGDAVAVTVRPLGPDISAHVRMVPAADRPFALQAERVRVAGVPVPGLLVNWVVRNFDPSARIASRMPFPVEIGRVAVRDDALRISRER